MTDEEIQKLFEAKMALSKFLNEHPNLREFQKKIDDTMSKAGNNVQNREIIFGTLVAENRKLLASKLQELLNECNNLRKKLTDE
jgi:hypothetical protein